MNTTKQNSKLLIIGFFTMLLLAVILISCNDDDDNQENDEVTIMIDEVRAATQNYSSFSAGVAAGWETDLSGCVAHPAEGGMGHHYGRMEFIDGRINHLEPQVLLYVPNTNGDMEFLGVEYMIPFAIHPIDEEPPVLFGQHYHPNEQIEMWTLHLWTEKENPNGIFYDWNPDVSCN